MAKKGSGGSGLDFKARVDLSEAKRNIAELKKMLSDVKVDMSSGSTNNFAKASKAMSEAMRNSMLETERLRQEGQKLRNEYEHGRISAQKLASEEKKLRNERKANTEAVNAARKAQVAANGSYNEAQARLKQLAAAIKGVEGGFKGLGPVQQARIKEYNKLNQELKEFDARMGNHQRNVGNYKSALDRLKGLTATYLSATAIIAAGRQVLNMNIELSDSLSDVQRTSGLTASEVEKLSDQLKKIDTRTSLKGLVDIAVIGGQLGIAKDQLVGFTTAINQLSVALGGELKGGPEGIAKSLGVLDNVFGVTTKNAGNVEKSFNQIGSAILGLGQSGLATGDYLADFSERVGGLAKQAGISLPVILSYGAVLQENGVSAEVAGSSFKRLISALTTNRQKFFAVAQLADAKLTLKEFTNIINTDAKKALDLFFAGLSKGGSTTTGFNDILKSLRISGAGVSQTVAALANSQQKLNGHIEQATKDFEDASLAADQYALKNDNLAGSWDKLINTIKNAFTSGPISGFFKAIIDGITNVTQKMVGLTKSRSWEEFFVRLNPFANADGYTLANRLNDNFKSRQSLSYDLNSIYDKKEVRGATLGLEDLRKAYVDALEAQKQAAKDFRDFQAGLKNDTIRDTNGQLKKLKTQFDYLKDQTEYFGNEYVKAKAKLPKSAVIGGSDGSTGDGLSDKERRGLEVAIKARNDMQARIDELTQKGLAKEMTANEQEVESVKRKYAEMQRLAEKFNNDSKNKKLGLRVDGSSLAGAQQKELNALADKQAAADLKDTLDKQKKLYEEYESFKSKVGAEKAKERYASQIDADKTYLETLERQYDQLTNPSKSKGGTLIDEKEVKQQLKVLADAIAAEKLAVQKRQDDLIASLMDFDAKRKKIESDYETDKAALGDQATEANIAQLDKRKRLLLEQLGDEHLKEIDAFKLLYAGIDRLSDDNAKKVVGNAEDALKALKSKGVVISKELEAELRKLFGDTRIAIADRLPERIINLANDIDRVADAVSGVDENFGKVLATLGGVVGQVGNIKKGVQDFEKAGKDKNPLGQLGAGLGIVGAGISIFKSVFSLFDRSKQREEQAAYARELQNKQTEAVNKALERQIALLDEAYGTDRILKYAEAFKSATDAQAKFESQLSGKYALTGDKTLDKYLERLNNGEMKLGGDPMSLALKNLIEKGAIKQLGDLGGLDVNQLKSLLENTVLDSSTAKILENLIQAKQAAIDLQNQLDAENVGSSLSQIADDFIKTLTDGTQDFGKSFEDTIRTSILNGFKGQLIQQQLQAFYTQFADLSKDGGLSEADIAALRSAYSKAAEKAKQDILDLEKATGIKLTGDTSKSPEALKPNTLTASINQPTAERLEGLWRGNFDLTKQLVAQGQTAGLTMGEMLQIGRSKLAILEKIAANTLRSADNTDRLAAIENTLAGIEKNTKPEKSVRD